jgi:uncharacterized protein
LKLTQQEARHFSAALAGWADTDQALRMRRFVQHGRISTYEHCMRVATASYWLSRRLHLGGDEESLIRGAFLHDFYLYDWHHCAGITRWHGFTHPRIALHEAQRYYPLNATEKQIIRSHMWPLTLTCPPACREAVVVCLADKWCSLAETLLYR